MKDERRLSGEALHIDDHRRIARVQEEPRGTPQRLTGAHAEA